MKPETIVINNFGGRLTRIINGDLNSGFAKFETSFGYDPFTKPMNLTWLGQPASIAGVQDVPVVGANYPGENSSGQYTYAVGSNGKVYQILVNLTSTENPNVDSIVAISSLQSAAASNRFNQGSGLVFFGATEKLYTTNSNKIYTTGSVIAENRFVLDGSVSVIGNSSYLAGTLHPLKKFAGNLIFGNGPSIGAIDATNTVISSVFTVNNRYGNQYSELFPPLPGGQIVRDLDVTPDGNYLQMSASDVEAEEFFVSLDPASGSQIGEGGLFGWNGVDEGVTTALDIPNANAIALQNFWQNRYVFSNDAFGASLGNGESKLLTLPNNKTPVPNAISTNGNFLTWMNPETVGNERYASMYYYGSLDQENPVGLYRLLRFQPLADDVFVAQVPYQTLVTGNYQSLSSSRDAVAEQGVGKHYFSTYSVNLVNTTPTSPSCRGFFKFVVSSNDSNPPQLGVYETQTQMFQKRIHIEQIRVYTESTVAGNGFQLDIIGVDGDPIENGTFTYSFVAGSDITKLEGSLQRINFNPKADAGYGFGIRLTNTGTTNMTIKKVEIDWGPEGR